jgi:pyruvate/2-oxoglutarate dehydrogenase complex dihydrolipoamide acyltransferase (E2) component
MTDRARKLDAAERWTTDIFRVSTDAGALVAVEAEMTRCEATLLALADQGLAATYTSMLVRACALALSRHPDLHAVVGATRRLEPGRVDIGLSVAGESPCAPVLVLEDAGRRSLVDLAGELRGRAAEVREKERRDLAALRRWGRLVPLSALRRAILRTPMRRPAFRRSIAGTFQVSTMRSVDAMVPLAFVATGVLAAGEVRRRVVADGDRAVVRPTVRLACSFDHAVWDGARAARFLTEVKRILEDEDLAA